jgi:hypothetical protein
MTLKIFKSNQKQHIRISSKGKRFIAGKGIVKDPISSYVYHVTRTSYVPSIKKRGLLIQAMPTNWERQGDKSRYGEGEIYTFENIEDALRWAARMDWGVARQTGSGQISVVKIKNTGDWQVDKNDPLGQAGSEGKWFKKIGKIESKDIIDSIPFTSDLAKRLVIHLPIKEKDKDKFEDVFKE